MEKRKISVLIPYRQDNGNVLVYLQKREKDAPRYPDCFTFFGGHGERGESPEETLRREIKEELDFVLPDNYRLLGVYEDDEVIRHVFTIEVGRDFEDTIRILEGEYGKFFKSESALQCISIEGQKAALEDLYKLLDRKHQ